MKVLLTGASGALGRAVAALIGRLGGFRLVVTDRQVDDNETSVPCDLSDPNQLSALLERDEYDLVLHLAATLSRNFEEACSINVEPARRILDWSLHRKSKMRVVLIGSAAEYGFVLPEANPVREDHVLNPVTVYGLSKAWQTQLSGLYTRRGVDVVCARIFNLYGPGVSEDLFAGQLHKQIKDISSGRRSIIEVGSLAAVRDYISTEDAAAQLLSIATRAESGGIYHIASGVPVLMRDFLIRQLKLNGLDPTIVRETAERTGSDALDVPIIYADLSKTRRLMLPEGIDVQA